jgi:hypothetical protein
MISSTKEQQCCVITKRCQGYVFKLPGLTVVVVSNVEVIPADNAVITAWIVDTEVEYFVVDVLVGVEVVEVDGVEVGVVVVFPVPDIVIVVISRVLAVVATGITDKETVDVV